MIVGMNLCKKLLLNSLQCVLRPSNNDDFAIPQLNRRGYNLVSELWHQIIRKGEGDRPAMPVSSIDERQIAEIS